jgi:RHS repeat-associated protein
MEPVPVRPVQARDPAPDQTVAAARRWAPRTTWPKAKTATVDLSEQAVRTPGALAAGVSGAVQAGALPVWLDGSTGLRRTKVELAGPDAAARAGVTGALVRLTPVDAPAAGAKVRAVLDHRGFAEAYGGDWSRRLSLVRLPACAWTTPEREDCRRAEPVAADNDRSRSRVAATVPVAAAEPVVLATAAGTSSDVGDYSATPLSVAGIWAAGGSSGDFSWKYPMRVPPSVGGPAPVLSLDYSAQSVDGRTAATNNQPSWAGEGWELSANYIERKYQSCDDDGHRGKGDLCWKYDNATLSLNGTATELVKDDATGQWRLAKDDGSRVEKLTNSAVNGDNDREYWRVTTVDGTQYVFGRHLLAAGQATTDSVWTVPVAGDDAGEPCHAADLAASFCTQAWRWNLDYVVDPHGNAMTYWYVPETNHYARNGDASPGTSYIRGGYLRRIDYGQRADTLFTAQAPMRVVFDVADRTSDVPTDQVCGAGQTCTGKLAPTFFTRMRLAKVTTMVWRASAYDDIDVWTLTHSYPDPGDGTAPVLWLSTIGHGGRAGSGAVDLPPVTFAGVPKENRVDAFEGVAEMIRWRIGSVVSETGGEVRVEYLPTECVRSAVPAPESNTKRCFPSYWVPQGALEPSRDWFHKYVVGQVLQTDLTGASRQMLTQYSYGGEGGAWHYDADGLTPQKYRTWSQWRGFATVTTTTGDPSEGTRSQTSELYFRGMDGDRAAPSGGVKNAEVTDSEGGKVADSDHFAGFPREKRTFNGPGGAEVSGEIRLPWARQTAFRNQSWGDARAYLVRERSVKGRTALDGGRGARRTTLVNDFTDDGLPVSADDRGDDATSTDDRCTRTTYAQNRTAWLLDYPARVEKVAAACTATGTGPGDVVGDVRMAYDGQAAGAAPTKGNPTKEERAASYSGGAPVYQVVATKVFDLHGRLTTVTDAADEISRTAYTPTTGGPLTKTVVTNPLGHTETVTHDPAWASPTVKLDANGKRTDLTYDALGRVTAVWLPGRAKADGLSASLKFAYTTSRSAATAVATSALRDGGTTYNTSYGFYDGWARERQTQDPAPGGGRIIADVVYDSRGLVSRKRADFYNDAAPAAGLVTTFDADTPALTTLLYDGAGRVIRDYLTTKGTLRWATTTTYGGDRTYADPPAGAPGTTTITDVRGNVVERREHPSGAPSGSYTRATYAYDAADRMTALSDADGNRWEYRYDIRGRQVEAKDPDRGTTISSYDDLDRLATTTNARGTTLAYGYDDIGRRTGLFAGSTAGTRLAAWTYDTVPEAKGQLAASIRYSGGQAYKREVVSYDDMYRPRRIQTVIPAAEGALAGTYRSGYDYGLDGTVHTEYLPDVAGLPTEQLVYQRNELGMPVKLTADPERVLVSDTVYTKLGELQLFRMPIDIDTTSPSKYLDQALIYEDGTRRLLQSTADQTGKEDVSDRSYGYDPAGNVTSIKELGGASVPDELECYRYDGHRRLTDAWTRSPGDCSGAPNLGGGPAPYWHSWSYTNAGLRATQTIHTASGDTTSVYSYPEPGQPRPHGVTSVTTGTATANFVYDATGNTTSRKNPATSAAQTLAWDAEGRLESITEGTTTTRNVYDAEGNLLIRRGPAETVLYLGATEAHLSAAGALSGVRYYTFNEKTVAMRSGGNVDLLITDHHNTPLISVDVPSQAVLRRRENPFGLPRTAPAGWPSVNQGFVGGTLDDGNRLVHLGAREYDPLYGRFLSVDPLLAPDQLQSLDGYTYSANNPATLSDPSGLMHPHDDESRPAPPPADDNDRRQPGDSGNPCRNGCGPWWEADGPTSATVAGKQITAPTRKALIAALNKAFIDRGGPEILEDCENRSNSGCTADGTNTSLNVLQWYMAYDVCRANKSWCHDAPSALDVALWAVAVGGLNVPGKKQPAPRGGSEPGKIGLKGVEKIEVKLKGDGHQIIGTEISFRIPDMTGRGSVRRYDIVSRKDNLYYLHEVKAGARNRYKGNQRAKDWLIIKRGAIAFGPRAADAGMQGWYDPAMLVIAMWRVP